MGNRRGGLVTPFRMLSGRHDADRFRVSSQTYDKSKASKAVRSLARQLRGAAPRRSPGDGQAVEQQTAEQRWSYLVDTTLEEMLAEAEQEQRLIEFRIALLRVEPSCRALLNSVRQAAIDPTGDAAKRLLKHAVAWRKVFGPEHFNRLEAVLELARMGAVVRNHTTAQRDLIYVATAVDMEGFRWNKKGAMTPSHDYLGQGYSRRSVEVTGYSTEPAVEITGVPVTMPVIEPSLYDQRQTTSRSSPEHHTLEQLAPEPDLGRQAAALMSDSDSLNVPLMPPLRRPAPAVPTLVSPPSSAATPAQSRGLPQPRQQQLRSAPLFEAPADLQRGPGRPLHPGPNVRGISR